MVLLEEVRSDVNKFKQAFKPNSSKNSNGMQHLEKITNDVTKIFVDLKEHLETLSWEQELLTWDENKLKSNFPQQAICSNTSSVNSKSENKQIQKIPNNAPPVQQQRSRSPSPSRSSNGQAQNKKLTNTGKQSIETPKQSISEPNRLEMYKTIVSRAKAARKTFTVCGNFNAIRRNLLSRGWVEKIRIYPNTFEKDFWKSLQDKTLTELLQGVNNREHGYAYRRMILSKLLGTHQVDFFWDIAGDAYTINKDEVKLTQINRFRRNVFSYTSKQGLCESVKTAYWYQRPGVANIMHPRAYTLNCENNLKDFTDNFRITAAISLLKWIVHTNGEKVIKLISPIGKIPIWSFHFAMNECHKYEKRLKHEDIDEPITEAQDFEWTKFLQCFYQLVHVANHFKNDKDINAESLVFKANIMLNRIKALQPHLDMDGMLNIWILKPTCGSQGKGINICQTLDYILKIVNENKKTRYVVQKYIERPLLIYKTKFDIRQWFLISTTTPLTIWIYKTCYLRFSSQTYNLRKLHKAIHLTNNSVQSHFKAVDRDKELPEDNMWDLPRFKKYLTCIGHADAWNKITYPGMKQGITAAILMNQENLDYRRNTFELYGADFMLTEDFIPWLIEINSRPALFASTKVTGRLCPMVLEDVVKVVVDRTRNPSAPVGNFELLYREKMNLFPANAKENLTLALSGKPVPKNFFQKPEEFDSNSASVSKISAKGSTISKTEKSGKSFSLAVSPDNSNIIKSITEAKSKIEAVSNDMKSTLEMLLATVKNESLRRKGSSQNSSDWESENNAMRSLKKDVGNSSKKKSISPLPTLMEVTPKTIKTAPENKPKNVVKTVDSKKSPKQTVQNNEQEIGILTEIVSQKKSIVKKTEHTGDNSKENTPQPNVQPKKSSTIPTDNGELFYHQSQGK